MHMVLEWLQRAGVWGKAKRRQMRVAAVERHLKAVDAELRQIAADDGHLTEWNRYLRPHIRSALRTHTLWQGKDKVA